MIRLAAATGLLAVVAAAAGFAALNRRQIVTLDVGIWTFYGVPLTWVLFVGILLGMGAMLLAGLHSDLRVRRVLRERLVEEDREEKARTDHRYQRDLFQPEDALGSSEDRSPPWTAGPAEGPARDRSEEGDGGNGGEDPRGRAAAS